MIPTPSICLTEVLSTIINDDLYKTLIQDQTIYLNNNKKSLLKKVYQFRKQVDKGYLPERIKERCCNFALLEEKCKEYEFISN